MPPKLHLTDRGLARSMHAALMYFQYRNNFLSRAYSQPISLHESHILIEIAARSGVTARELVDLGLGTQVLVGRRVGDLIKLGLVTSQVSDEDRRKQLLSLTAKGELIRGRIDAHSNELKRRFGIGFSEAELAELAHLIHGFCDVGRIPKTPPAKNEPALRPALRRLARFMGVTGALFMGSAFSSGEWQVLQAIRYARGTATAKSIGALLDIEQSILSRTLAGFTKLKLVVEEHGRQDARRKTLSVTQKGLHQLEGIDRRAAERIGNNLVAMPSYERVRLVILLAEYAFGRLPPNLENCSYSTDFTEGEMRALREWFVRTKLSEPTIEIPYELLHPENRTAAAFSIDSGKPVGLIEIKRGSRSTEVEVVNLCFEPSFAESYFDVAVTTLHLIKATVGSGTILRRSRSCQEALAFIDLRILGVQLG